MTCTTRTLEGMYIFSNPPKAVAAPVSLKLIGKPTNYKNYRTSTIANNYRSIYSPNHFITGRPLSGYWWREKKETYEQRMNSTPLSIPTERPNDNERLGSVVSIVEKSVQDAICQTEALKEEKKENDIPLVDSACQTTTVVTESLIDQHNIPEPRINSAKILAEVEATRKQEESELVPLEVVSRMLAHSFIEEMMPNLMNKFKEAGFSETFHNSEKEDNAVLPWLMNELELGLTRLEASYKMLNDSTIR